MKKLITIPAAISLLLSQVSSALADANPIIIEKPSTVKFDNLGKLISNAISLVMIFAAILTFVYLVWGGIEWITSGGDKAGTESARSKITSAFIGLFIVFAAWAIVKVIETFFGICVLNCPLTIPGP